MEQKRGLTTAGWPFLVLFMRSFTAVVERDPDTGLFVGYIPGWAGAHSQGATLDELRENLREVVAMLLDDGDPRLEAEFIGTQSIAVCTGAASAGSQTSGGRSGAGAPRLC
jgi:predicted RNase H-like HicB family nuclease